MLLFIQRKRNRWNVTGQAGVTNSVQLRSIDTEERCCVGVVYFLPNLP